MPFTSTQQLFDFTCLQLLLQDARCIQKGRFFYRLGRLRSPIGLFIRSYKPAMESVPPHAAVAKLGQLSAEAQSLLLALENIQRSKTMVYWRLEFNALARARGLAERNDAFWGTAEAGDVVRTRTLLARSLATVTKDFVMEVREAAA